MKNKNIGAEEIYLAPEEVAPEEATEEEVVKEETPPTDALLYENRSTHKHRPKHFERKERMNEIPELREANRKVFRLNDGSEQAVFYPEAVHVLSKEKDTFDDVNMTVIPEEDGRHYIGDQNRFKARFSREEDNDELFSVESGIHRITVSAQKRKSKKNRPIIPRVHKKDTEEIKGIDLLTFENVEDGTDYEYSMTGNGVKENIIVKEKADVYRFPFILHCENVTPQLDDQESRIAFLRNETGEEIFFIPAPFMTDASGVISTAVSYDMKETSRGDTLLVMTADREFMDAEDRVFPVTIDPQIKLSATSAMTTYSWSKGQISNSNLHMVGMVRKGNNEIVEDRMYLNFNMPSLPRNPRIKKAELVFTQSAGSIESERSPKFGIYHVTGTIATGNCTPCCEKCLIDFAVMRKNDAGDGKAITYSFDVTTLMDMVNKGEISARSLVMKIIGGTNSHDDHITLYGSGSGTKAPQLTVTYENTYGVNTSYRTHTHELGRFGQGSIDLQCGNLMFESEDFAWSGNRMPVTLKHLYNSALSDHQYTSKTEIRLITADFSRMRLGLGYKLNIMQSMIRTYFTHEGIECLGYVYIGENGEETYFKENKKMCLHDSNSQCYYLFEDVNGGNMLYDPKKRTLTQGSDTYLFSESGMLIKVTDEFGNHMDITYTSGRITSVTDGAGRVFGFTYSGGRLASITAPDNTNVIYGYTGDLLTSVRYPEGKRVQITYTPGNKPSSVVLKDTNGNDIYKMEYTFYGDRVTSVTECGVADGNYVNGKQSFYRYSAASATTEVETTEGSDENPVKTVYTFDDDGNTVSEYVYSKDTGNTGTEGEEGGILPYSGEDGIGIVSNINNVLTDHNFDSLNTWGGMPSNCSDVVIESRTDESKSKFGGKVLHMISRSEDCDENGVYQTSNMLPAGDYTFSAYIRVTSQFKGCTSSGAFIRVTNTRGKVLAESERLCKRDTDYTRLIAPFTLKTAQCVQVQIITHGKGAIYADAAQLENNPYANAYNMLENGNFERESGWTMNGASYANDTHFNMRRSLKISGDLEADRNATQKVAVKKNQKTRETFTLSGWAKGYGLPDHERTDVENAPTFRLRAEIKYSNGETESHTADFSHCTEEWQLASVQFAKTKFKSVEDITVCCEYGYNSGNAFFDDIQLVRDSIETNLGSSDFDSDTPYEEQNEDNTDQQDEDTAPSFNEIRDAFGNTLTETTFTDGEFGTIYRAFKFNEDDNCCPGNDAGNNLIEETDARGNKTSYTVDGDTSRNEEVVDRLGNKTAYEYDNGGKTTKVTSKDKNNNELANVSYAYDTFDNMTEIARGDGLKYALAYNAFHNLESIGIDGKAEKLVQYTYKNGNGKLKQITYANGDYMSATYNSAGQMIAEKWFDSANALTAHYKYVYDGKGNIVRSIDFLGKKEYNYEYEDGKIIRATECDITLNGEIVISDVIVSTIKYKYDSDGNLISKNSEDKTGIISSYFYDINETEDEVVRVKIGSSTVTSHSKTDKFLRKVFDELETGTTFVSRQFNYLAGAVTSQHQTSEKLKSTATTQLVSQIVFSDERTISYKYDAEDRIIHIDDSISGVVDYTYNALGLLESETINGVTTKFIYDDYGNILQKGFVDDSGNISEATKISYIYGDEIWKDLLTSYNGHTIEYDAQGNPTSYLGHTLTWEKGRLLNRVDNNIYAYNANGVRVSKNVNGVLHSFFLEGTKIVCEKWGSNILIPLYDNEDIVCGIVYNNVPYYFHRNLQDDIISIVDKAGNTVARYEYDAWGACISATGDCEIASINPFRYRGYYYDIETGYYYLQTRYYDPATGRFLNSDDIKYLGTTDCPIGFNLFSYCDNNPVNRSDVNGHSWISDRFNDVKNAAKKIAKAVSNTAQKVASTAKNVTTTVKNAVVDTAKKAATTVTNATKSLVTTVSGAAKDAVDWTKNKINDITKGVKKVATKAKEAVVEAWNWTTKKALPVVGNFFSETVWKKWIVGGVWETFCKDWVWETFCKDWVWETFCKDWVWETFCKKWVWQTVIQGTWYKINPWIMDTLTKAALGQTNLVTIVSIDQSNKNLLHNTKEMALKNWAINRSPIYYQGYMTGYSANPSDYNKYGRVYNEAILLKCCNDKDLAKVGCGLVAVYNIGVLSGNYMDMRSIIYWFEQNKGFILNAVFGLNPNVIQNFFDNVNIPARGFSDISSLESSRTTSGLYIICQWNSATDISQGAHFYAVEDSAGLLTPYNGAGNYTSALATHHSDFASMISYDNGGSMIYAYRIG